MQPARFFAILAGILCIFHEGLHHCIYHTTARLFTHTSLSAKLWAPWGQRPRISSFLCLLNTQDCTWSAQWTLTKEHFSKWTNEPLFSLAETISGVRTNRHEMKEGHSERWLRCLSYQGTETASSNRVYFQDTQSRLWGVYCSCPLLQLQNSQFLQGTWTVSKRMYFPVSSSVKI